MVYKIITLCTLMLYMVRCVGMTIETTDKIENTGIRWNCEIYNKSNYVATIFIGNKIVNDALIMDYLGTILPTNKIRTTIDRSMPLVIEILKGNQKGNPKMAEVFVMPCLPNQFCAKTVFLTLDHKGLRPQTGQWYGFKGVTDSEMDITNNIKTEQLQYNWEYFAAQNKRFFKNKVYGLRPSQVQGQSVYQKTKEKLSELWYGQPLSQEELAREVALYKNRINNEADDLLRRVDRITDQSFKKLTARAILNKWKKESVKELDAANNRDDIKTIYENFLNKTSNTKQAIERAK